MLNIFVISGKNKIAAELHYDFGQNYLVQYATSQNQTVTEQLAKQAPDLVLVELNGYSGTWELAQKIKQESTVPIIAIVSRESLDRVDCDMPIDDFLVSPCDKKELVFRAKRLLTKVKNRDNGVIIRHGDLIIDQDRCEVTLSGRKVTLTFKEYELLKFLASSPGHIFTRDTLLDRVWGYDYYGGDRTVDVHIRRLRSKIEDSSHTFIETVRNIGYRFQSVVTVR